MSDQENDPPTKPPGNPKAATSPTRLTSSPIRMPLSPVRAGPRQTEESEVAVPRSPDRNVQIIGNGHPIATSGTPVYDEDPLDLTIGLHFSTENLITEHRDQRGSLVRAFEAMRAEFMTQTEEDLHFWITLSTCHTQVDFVMGVEQEEPPPAEAKQPMTTCSEFSGNVTDMISMDYAFAQVSEEFWPFCINKISSGTPFPVDSYPVAFDGFTSHLSVTGFAPVNPYDVVLKVPSRTTGATYGMVQPNRRRSKRSHDDENNYEVTVTPIDKNSFSEEGDSGAAVVNGKGEMVGIIVSGKNFVTVEQDSIATPEKRTKSPLRKRAPTPPDVPTTASLTPRTPFEYTARKEWTEGFRQVTILPIAPMQADLWNRFGMRMELYRPSDEVRSRYPSKSTVRQEQFAAYPPRPKAHTPDTYAWYKKACEEGVFTQKEQRDWKSKVATEGSSFGALTFRPGKIARTS
ncbi:hypothetical protein D6C85_07428 [Aureobasidium pullulans]|uniref:Uncharacterized protein n=1 Tax=Aureobasidium pullulans TaxID=5580 RepID=A0A4S9WT41_AURPU|nr:hypothetical protein D6D20_02017 [Aureobasidium pullulans]THZ68533.1 hypothetical protein D6C85_07428 [Aureobasidium pullulans]